LSAANPVSAKPDAAVPPDAGAVVAVVGAGVTGIERTGGIVVVVAV
jgi:NADH dehydrogenase FAD-containing subunit